MSELTQKFQDETIKTKEDEIKSLVEANAKLRWQLDDLKHNINLLFGIMDIDFPEAISHNQTLVNKITGITK